jgi:hypothetical protein
LATEVNWQPRLDGDVAVAVLVSDRLIDRPIRSLCSLSGIEAQRLKLEKEAVVRERELLQAYKREQIDPSFRLVIIVKVLSF